MMKRQKSEQFWVSTILILTTIGVWSIIIYEELTRERQSQTETADRPTEQRPEGHPLRIIADYWRKRAGK